MSKLALVVFAAFLAGCASMGEWRTLSIDGTNQAVFGESLTRLNDELSYSRKQMLGLALVDIANVGVQEGGVLDDGSPAYTDEDFRADLNGLTYEGVIALADQSGPSISRLYYSRNWIEATNESVRVLEAGDHAFRPTPPQLPPVSFDSNGNPFIEWPDQ